MPDGTIKRVRVDTSKTGGGEPEPEKPNYAQTALTHALRGATFGFSDELAGLGGKLIGKDYKTTRDAVRKYEQEAKAANPKTALASELAGALPTAALPILGQVGRGAKALGAIGKSARIGAGEGGLYAMGASTSEDPKVQARDATVGMGLGGLLGGGITGATKGLHNTAKNLFSAVGKNATQRSIGKVLRNAGETPEGINQRAASDPALTPADVSPDLQQLLGTAMQTASPVRNEAVEQAGVRLSAQKQKVLDKLTGKQVADAETVVQNYKTKNAPVMKKAYDEAYTGNVDVGKSPAFEGLLSRPSVRKALTESLQAYTDRTGKVVEGDVLPVEVLDKMSGILGDAMAGARMAREGTKATTLSKAKAAWDGWLKDHAPESLFKARKLAEKNFQFEDAVRQGQDYLNTPSKTITDNLIKFKDKPELLKAYRAGTTDAVAKKMSRVKEGASLDASFTPAEHKRLKAIMGPRYKTFKQSLETEGKIAKTRTAVQGAPHIEGVPAGVAPPASHINMWMRLAQQAAGAAQRNPVRKRKGELVEALTNPQGLKGIPTPELINAIGAHRFGGASGMVPQMGTEPYPGHR